MAGTHAVNSLEGHRGERRPPAGCCTSSSVTIVRASLVTKSLSKWLITILFIPLGPIEVRTITASCLHASICRRRTRSAHKRGWTDGRHDKDLSERVARTFFSTASSSPLICFAPSFNIELIPPAVAKAILS